MENTTQNETVKTIYSAVNETVGVAEALLLASNAAIHVQNGGRLLQEMLRIFEFLPTLRGIAANTGVLK